MFTEIEILWRQGKLFKTAFDEYKLCIEAVFKEAQTLLQSPPKTPPEFDVRLAAIPDDFYSMRRNLFSTLFQSVYHLLNIHEDRRLLYGKLNHLFRIWVTSADNLLDNEDKIVVPMEITGSSRVMRQVISIMLADRILKNITDQAVDNKTIRPDEASLLTHKSLQILLPSAAEEASEESGITHRPNPDYILNTIHRLKTGLLFHIPFLGPDTIEFNIDKNTLALCKEGLMSFGLGCQILDDIRDIAKDYLEMRHSYILSTIYTDNPLYVAKLDQIEPDIDVSSNIFELFPNAVHPAADRAVKLLTDGLLSLGSAGLGISRPAARHISLGMFDVLGVGGLTKCLNI
jgi:iron-sulfur cluster repair protein YtfE (RIC family)